MKNLSFDFSAGEKHEVLVLDLETQYLSHEVSGGWTAVEKLRVAVIVTWDEAHGNRVWYEDGVPRLLQELPRYKPIVTFNGEEFDFRVLSAYGSVAGLYESSRDLLVELSRKLGFRVKLQSLAQTTLGRGKGGSGYESVEWWRTGDVASRQKVVDYCTRDVELTRDLYLFGRAQGFVIVEDAKKGEVRQVEVDW